MKKIKVTGLMTGLIILLTISAKAQYFYTSYGYAQEWQLPNYIEHTIYNDYYGYEVAHVERQAYYGYTNFNVLLHRGNMFIEVRFDRFGGVYRTIRYNHFPLNAHNCSTHCGYHKVYYQTYYYPTHHHHYYNPYSTTVVVTQTEPKHHHHTYVNNNYTKVYVQPNDVHNHNNGNGNRGNANYNNNGNGNRQYNNSGNNTNVQRRTDGQIHRPTVTSNENNRTSAPRYVAENRSNETRSASGRGATGRGNK